MSCAELAMRRELYRYTPNPIHRAVEPYPYPYPYPCPTRTRTRTLPLPLPKPYLNHPYPT